MTKSLNSSAWRTHECGRLTSLHIGQVVQLAGWVHRFRDHGQLLFINLRDHSGLVQLVVPDITTQNLAGLGSEAVITVTGLVKTLGKAAKSSGGIAVSPVEIEVSNIKILNPATTPAIPVAQSPDVPLPSEEARLVERVLDLRRPELQQAIRLRHRLLQAARQTLTKTGCLEIETPILTKPTPEGARDYLVPSRVHNGEFYALPQSPQVYKQLLMVAGFERYFQIARCFRDEDLRSDRQPEFTQIDIEASFVTQPEVREMVENVARSLWEQGAADGFVGALEPSPFPVLTFKESQERFGTDKPDLRFAL